MVFDRRLGRTALSVSNTMFPAPRLIVYDGKSRNPRVREGKGKHAGGVGE